MIRGGGLMIDLMKEKEVRRRAAGDPLPAMVMWFLDRLPENQRLSLWLYFAESMPPADVANVMAVSEYDIHPLIGSALRRLDGNLARAGLRIPRGRLLRILQSATRGGAPALMMENLSRMLLVSPPVSL